MTASDTIYTDGTYLKMTGTWHEEDSPWKAGQIIKILDRNGVKPATVCEVGCGAGEILNRLSHQMSGVREFHGYEISPQAFELCCRKSGNNLKFQLADLLEETNKTYDVVMAIDVFEHVEDYLGFLERFKSSGDYI